MKEFIFYYPPKQTSLRTDTKAEANEGICPIDLQQMPALPKLTKCKIQSFSANEYDCRKQSFIALPLNPLLILFPNIAHPFIEHANFTHSPIDEMCRKSSFLWFILPLLRVYDCHKPAHRATVITLLVSRYTSLYIIIKIKLSEETQSLCVKDHLEHRPDIHHFSLNFSSNTKLPMRMLIH